MHDEDRDDAGPSQWRGSEAGQGCNTWAPKDEPPSDDDDEPVPRHALV
jgi:hypothetical protein